MNVLKECLCFPTKYAALVLPADTIPMKIQTPHPSAWTAQQIVNTALTKKDKLSVMTALKDMGSILVANAIPAHRTAISVLILCLATNVARAISHFLLIREYNVRLTRAAIQDAQHVAGH